VPTVVVTEHAVRALARAAAKRRSIKQPRHSTELASEMNFKAATTFLQVKQSSEISSEAARRLYPCVSDTAYPTIRYALAPQRK
jgi:hypothetical protein